MIIEHDPCGIVVRWPHLDLWLLIDAEDCHLVYQGRLLISRKRFEA